VRLAVAFLAASGYAALRALDARLAVLRQTLAARGEESRVVRHRADAGYSSQLELAQVEAAYRATEPLILPTELAIACQKNGLSLLIGESPRAMDRGIELHSLVISEPLVTVPATLLRRRLDIATAEAQLAASDHALDAAREAFMPDVQLAAFEGLTGFNLALDSPFEYWSVGASILAPIFSGGRLEAQQDIATARRD
jgi:outer membrane protein TolC